MDTVRSDKGNRLYRDNYVLMLTSVVRKINNNYVDTVILLVGTDFQIINT